LLPLPFCHRLVFRREEALLAWRDRAWTNTL